MKKLIVIAGATGIGKTDLAIEIAKQLNTEILSADSRQCYRELNIGVAKPSSVQLASIPHHFINSHSVLEPLSAGIFERYSLKKLTSIFTRSDYAICTGGTGLYIRALCNGIDAMPDVDQSIYQELDLTYRQKGLTWLKEEIRQQDPTFYEEGENQNPARMLRALTFKLSSGKSILEYRTKTSVNRPFEIIKYAIEMDRELLYNRINMRVDQMMHAGLLKEVEGLIDLKHLKSLNTVGYREIFDYLEGQYDLSQSIAKIKQHTRNYAKRQITWFKNQDDFQWLHAEQILNDLLKMKA